MITKDTKISEILEIKPQAAEVLMGMGMGCLGCPSASMESLENACQIHGVDLEDTLAKINAL